MTRDEINAIGVMLKGLREDGDGRVVVSFASFGPDADCSNGSIMVGIQRGRDEVTGHAVALADALSIARGKVRDLDAKRAREAEDAKTKGATA